MDQSVPNVDESSDDEDDELVISQVLEKSTRAKVTGIVTGVEVSEEEPTPQVAEQAPIAKVVGANTPSGKVTYKQLQEALMSGNLVLVDADVNTTLKNLEELSNAQTSASRQP